VTWPTLANARLPGTELFIAAEAHVVGEREANRVFLDELPVFNSVSIPGFAETAADPLPGQFRVRYDGELAGTLDFHPNDGGASVPASYSGRGSVVYAHHLNDLATGKRDSGPVPWGDLSGVPDFAGDFDPLGAAAAAVAAHEALGDPHSQYLTPAEGAAAFDALGAATAAVAAHAALTDPHAQYLTQAEGDAAYDVLGAASAAIAAHLAASDPHTQYLNNTRGDARYDAIGAASAAIAAHVALGDPHSQYLNNARGDARYDAIGAASAAIAAHLAASDPHTQYHTDARGDARYSQLGHTHTFGSLSAIPTTLAGYGITDAASSAALAAHEADTTAIHGIADTSLLVLTSDGRLSDARTPTAHAASHGPLGSDRLDATYRLLSNLDFTTYGSGVFDDLLINGESVPDIVLENTYFDNMQFGHGPAAVLFKTGTGGSSPAYADLGAFGTALIMNGAGTAPQFRYIITADVSDLLSGSHTWALSQIFSASASFQSGTVPFVVVGTDRVDNLDAHYLGAAGQDDAFFRNAGNLNAGNLAYARLPGTTAGNWATAGFSIGTTGYTGQNLGGSVRALTIQSVNTPAWPVVQLHSDSDSLADGTDVKGLQWWFGHTTPTLCAAIAAVVSGTSENAAHLSLRTATGGTLTEAMRIRTNGLVLAGTQVANAGMVLGDLTQTTITSLGSGVGLDIYADFNSSAAAITYINRNTGTSAGLVMQYGFADSAGTVTRAGFLEFIKTAAWTNGTNSTKTADFRVRVANGDGTVSEGFRVKAGGFLVSGNDNGSIVLGASGALATSATQGFAYFPSMAGTPSGVPTGFTGKLALVADTTAFKLWGRFGSSWKSVTFA
jgi:hypothetical protein